MHNPTKLVFRTQTHTLIYIKLKKKVYNRPIYILISPNYLYIQEENICMDLIFMSFTHSHVSGSFRNTGTTISTRSV